MPRTGVSNDADMLMLRRATHEPDPWSGHVALPGGRAEAGDATLLDTAIRETREETALELRGARVLGALDELRPRTPSLPPVIVRPYVLTVAFAPPLVASAEVAELFWAPLSSLFDPARALRTAVTTRAGIREVDAIDFEGRIIWGMTHHILRTFESLLAPR